MGVPYFHTHLDISDPDETSTQFYRARQGVYSGFSLTVIDIANRGYTGFAKKFLENRVVQYLSKISYGIYLYHLIAALFFWRIFDIVQRVMNEKGYDLSATGR